MSRRQAWSTGKKLAKLSQSNQALVADWLAGADNLNKLLCDRPTDQWTKRWLSELRVLDFKIWIWPHDRLSDYHHWLFKSVQLSPTLMQIDAKGLINFICYRQFLVLPRAMYVVSGTQCLAMHKCEEAEQPPWEPWTTPSGHREWTKWGIESRSTRLKTHLSENKPFIIKILWYSSLCTFAKYYLQTDKRLA